MKQPSPLFLNHYSTPICAGFPSPADDYSSETIDLNSFLISNRPSTYLFKMEGDALRGDAIAPGDIFVVDASLLPTENSLVVAQVHGEILVRHFFPQENVLRASHVQYPPIYLHEENEFAIFGVVTSVIRKLYGKKYQ